MQHEPRGRPRRRRRAARRRAAPDRRGGGPRRLRARRPARDAAGGLGAPAAGGGGPRRTAGGRATPAIAAPTRGPSAGPRRSRSSSTSWPTTPASASRAISPATASSSAAWWWASSRPRRRSATRSSNEAVGWSGPDEAPHAVVLGQGAGLPGGLDELAEHARVAHRRVPEAARATRPTSGPPSTRCRSVSMLSTGERLDGRGGRRCPSFTRWSNGVGPPVVRIVRTANTVARLHERADERPGQVVELVAVVDQQEQALGRRPASRSAAAARWKTAATVELVRRRSGRRRRPAAGARARRTGSIDPRGARAHGRSAARRRRRARRPSPPSRVLPTPAPPVRRTPPVRSSRNHAAEHLELAAAPDHRPRRGRRRFDDARCRDRLAVRADVPSSRTGATKR